MLYSVILKNEEEKMAIKNLNLSSTSRDQRSRFTKYKTSIQCLCMLFHLSILSCRISLLRCMKRKLYAVDTPISMPPIESFEVWSNAVIIIFNYQEFLLLLIK